VRTSFGRKFGWLLPCSNSNRVSDASAPA
jgi:hypothetical protein